MTMNLRPIIRYWPLILMIILGLFPFGWFGELWPRFGVLLGIMFPGVFGHAIGHTCMFFLIGGALLLAFPALCKRPIVFFGMMVLIGLCQETFQLAYKQRPLEFDEFRDLITDMIGSGIAYLCLRHRPRT